MAKSLKTNHVQLYKSRMAKSLKTNHVQLYKSQWQKASRQIMFNFTKVDGKKLEDKSCSTLQKSMAKSLKKTKYIQLYKSHAEKMSLRGHRTWRLKNSFSGFTFLLFLSIFENIIPDSVLFSSLFI